MPPLQIRFMESTIVFGLCSPGSSCIWRHFHFKCFDSRFEKLKKKKLYDNKPTKQNPNQNTHSTTHYYIYKIAQSIYQSRSCTVFCSVLLQSVAFSQCQSVSESNQIESKTHTPTHNSKKGSQQYGGCSEKLQTTHYLLPTYYIKRKTHQKIYRK